MTTSRVRDLPELRLLRPPSLRLAPNHRVPLPDEYADLIDHPLMQRLRGIRQLGFVDRVYPSATHSRFEHSVGVFFNTLHYAHALLDDPYNSYFEDTMGRLELRSLFVAALLHDLGQYPFSHVLEDSERGEDGGLDESAFDHAKLTLRLLTNPARTEGNQSDPDIRKLLETLGVTSNDVASVLTGKDIGDLTKGAPAVLKSIIDGPIDADKLDYLLRDSYHAGVHFGDNIDVHRFLQALTVVPDDYLQDLGKPGQIGLTRKGRVPAEQIMLARYHMFSEVYWHRTVRAHEAILAHAVKQLRAVYSGFDSWFIDLALGQDSTDESVLRGLTGLARGESNLSLRENTEGGAAVLRRSLSMLESLYYSSGRTPFKRLVSVSATDDMHLYVGLQKIRDASLGEVWGPLEKLQTNFAEELHKNLNQEVDATEIVFDIPAKRSPANTAFIVATRAPQREVSERLVDRWPMWQEFTRGFSSGTRQIRVYCEEEVRSRILDPELTHELIAYDCLRSAAVRTLQDLSPQTELF